MLESLIKIKVIRLREYETYFYCYLKCRRYIIRISFKYTKNQCIIYSSGAPFVSVLRSKKRQQGRLTIRSAINNHNDTTFTQQILSIKLVNIH